MDDPNNRIDPEVLRAWLGETGEEEEFEPPEPIDGALGAEVFTFESVRIRITKLVIPRDEYEN